MGVMRQKLYRFVAALTRWLWPQASLSPRRVLIALGLVVVSLVVPLPALLLDGLLLLSWLVAGVFLAAAVQAGEPTRLPQLPTVLLLSLLMRIGLTLSLARLGLLSGQLGLLPQALFSLLGSSEPAVALLVLGALLVTQYVLIARGGERVAEVAARFVLDALPGRQAAIDADLRAGVIGAVEAQQARQLLSREAELFGSLDGVMRLIRGDVLLAMLLWLGLFVVGMLQLSTGSGLPMGDAATQAGALTLTVGLCTQAPVLLVTMAAVVVLLRGTSSHGDSSDEAAPLQLQIAADVSLSQAQAQTIVDRVGAQVGLGTLRCSLQTDPQLRRQLRISLHGAILTQHTLSDGEDPQITLTYRLYDLVPELLTIDGLRRTLSQLGAQRPALLSEVVPKRVPLGRLLPLLRRLLAERVWPLPIAAVLDVLAQLPELDADPDALVEQVRAGLGRHLLSGHLLRNPAPEPDNALAALVLSSDVEEVLRDARRSSGGLRLQLEPELRQEIIDSVLLAKARAPEAVLLCQRDIRRSLEILLGAHPEALPVLAFSELPPQLALRVVSRIGPGSL